jgi:hypothetical protein
MASGTSTLSLQRSIYTVMGPYPGHVDRVRTALIAVVLGTALIASSLARAGGQNDGVSAVNRTAEAIAAMEDLRPPRGTQEP